MLHMDIIKERLRREFGIDHPNSCLSSQSKKLHYRKYQIMMKSAKSDPVLTPRPCPTDGRSRSK